MYQLGLEENRVRWLRIKQIVLDKFNSFFGLRCIEIGAGSGHYSMLFACQGANVTLLDYSKKALDFSQNVFKDQGISESKVQFIHMDALRIDHSLFDKYDVSMSFGVAEHFQGKDRKNKIQSHYNVMRKGGITFISVPNANCIPLRIYQLIMKFKKKRCYRMLPLFEKRIQTDCP